LISIAEAPGKIIISGEHFVVHGSQALAAAINQNIRVSCQFSRTNTINYKHQRLTSNYNFTHDPVAVVRNKTLSYLNRKENLSLEIESHIPRGSGLGSSSALCVATVSSIASLFDEKLSKKTIYDLAMNGEKIIHGNPSGIDVAVSVFGGLILFRKGNEPKKISLDYTPEFIVSVSGRGRKTSKMINKFNNFQNLTPNYFNSLVDSSHILTKDVLQSLLQKDYIKLGSLLTFFNSTLSDFGLSTAITDQLIDLCLEFGAYGAKITGAGGGGSIIAIAPSKKTNKIIQELNNHGFKSFSVKLPQNGVRTWSKD